MIRRRRHALLTLPALGALLMSACASRRELPFDAALFPRALSPPRTPLRGRIAVVLQPAVEQLMHEGDDGPVRGLRIPVGRIVAEAMLRMAAPEFAGGALQLSVPAGARADARAEAGTDAGTDAGFAALLRVQAVRVSYHTHLLWFIPLPILGGPGDQEFDVHLAFDISLLDPQGQVVWTRSYDDGRQIWKHEWTEQYLAPDALLRLTYETACQLAQQAVHDAVNWVLAERMRPRGL